VPTSGGAGCNLLYAGASPLCGCDCGYCPWLCSGDLEREQEPRMRHGHVLCAQVPALGVQLQASWQHQRAVPVSKKCEKERERERGREREKITVP